MNGKLTHLSLFSGIGGIDIAAEAAGFETIGQCELADFPRAVLEYHFPNVPKWKDIRTLTKESFTEKTGLQTVDLVSGGFPCQPFSQAGLRKGDKDVRALFPEMLRVIRELKPRAVLGENVRGLISLGLDYVLASLEGEDYSAFAILLPASAAGAPHQRYRLAIIALSNASCKRRTASANEAEHSSSRTQRRKHVSRILCETPERFDRELKRDVCRVANGIPAWLDEAPPRLAPLEEDTQDRIRALGNAVVPAQFYPILRTLHTILINNQ